jgi:DNA polymerase-3 subunit alpha
MQICNSLSNFSVTDGYIMIKAIGKKKIDLMQKYEKLFVDGAVKNGVPEEIVKQYWTKFIVPFANYGFNKCLDGKMRVKDKNTGKYFYIGDLAELFKNDIVKPNITLDSCKNNEIIEDNVLDVFETGEKEVYEIELDNGIVLKSTLDHKFMCGDYEFHTVEDIFQKNLDILYAD